MGVKYRNLKDLHERKINTHEFYLYKTAAELLSYSKINDKFSIRFDSDSNYHSRPFRKYNIKNFNSLEERVKFFDDLEKEAKKEKCEMLVSNGYLYDEIQICNFVIKIDRHHDFVLEWSTEETSLREMYNYPTSVLKGNINDSLKDMEWINKDFNQIDNKNIEEILSWSFNLECYNKNIEGTLYPINIGMYKQKIVCWQTD